MRPDASFCPGFEDCHIHFMDGSLGLAQVDLNDAKTVAEIQKRVKEYAASHPSEPWITGMGWTYPTFGAAALPDKKILDDVVPDRPVYLVAFDGHSSWANSKALAMAGITEGDAGSAERKDCPRREWRGDGRVERIGRESCRRAKCPSRRGGAVGGAAERESTRRTSLA